MVSIRKISTAQIVIDPNQRLTSEELRAKTLALVTQIELAYVELAKRLYEIKASKYYLDWGFETWEEYCETELKITRRTADYLVSIWSTIIAFPDYEKKIASIQWSKAREIVRALKVAPRRSVLDRFIEVAEKKSLRELQKAVDEFVRKHKAKFKEEVENEVTRRVNEGAEVGAFENTSQVSDEQLIEMKFLLYPDAYRVVQEALALASRITGSDSRSYALQTIALEYLASNSDLVSSKDGVEMLINFFERLEKVLGIGIIAFAGSEIVFGKKYLNLLTDENK